MNASYDYNADPVAAFHFRTRLRLVVDLQNCAKAQASRAYARKVKLSNLQQMARTICYVQEHHYGSYEELDHERITTSEVIDRLSDTITKTEDQIATLRGSADPQMDTLLQLRDNLRKNRNSVQKYLKELQVVCSNVEVILQGSEKMTVKEKTQDL